MRAVAGHMLICFALWWLRPCMHRRVTLGDRGRPAVAQHRRPRKQRPTWRSGSHSCAKTGSRSGRLWNTGCSATATSCTAVRNSCSPPSRSITRRSTARRPSLAMPSRNSSPGGRRPSGSGSTPLRGLWACGRVGVNAPRVLAEAASVAGSGDTAARPSGLSKWSGRQPYACSDPVR